MEKPKLPTAVHRRSAFLTPSLHLTADTDTENSSTKHSHEHIPLPRGRRLGMRTRGPMLHQLHPPSLRHPPPRLPAPGEPKRRHRPRGSQRLHHFSDGHSDRNSRHRRLQRRLLFHPHRQQIEEQLRRPRRRPRRRNTAWDITGGVYSAAVPTAEEVERGESGGAAVGRRV